MYKPMLSGDESHKQRKRIYEWMHDNGFDTVTDFCKYLNINTSTFYTSIGSRTSSRRITVNSATEYITAVVDGKLSPSKKKKN